MTATAEATTPRAVIDVEALLAPIPGENPAGENLQYAGLYDDIREARRSEESLEQGDWKRDTKAADWWQVERLATGALAARTKDLQVCAWLAEALVKLHGLPGFRDGLRLMRGLHEQFWDSLYPENDEGDLEARANSVTWMDRQAAMAIKEAPITNAMTGVNYSYIQWEESRQFTVPENLEELDSDELRAANETKQRAAEEGKITSEQWRMAERATRRAFYEETHALLNECWDELLALDHVMDDKFGRETPGVSAMKKSLDALRSCVEKAVKEKRLLEPDSAEPAAAEGETPQAQAAGGVGIAASAGPVRSRQEALKRLSEVADYFRQAEPHSPVSYLVQRAVKWGQMPLEVWLQDVIKDDAVLDGLRDVLGIKASSGGGE